MKAEEEEYLCRFGAQEKKPCPFMPLTIPCLIFPVRPLPSSCSRPTI